MQTIITHSSKETKALAKELIFSVKNTNIITLHGDLGSGKTTFAQGIGEALGINRRMISPTFIVVRRYRLQPPHPDLPFRTLYHIDLYRTHSPDEVVELGITDFLKDQTNLLIIEWPEKMGELLPKHKIEVQFEYINETDRKITLL